MLDKSLLNLLYIGFTKKGGRPALYGPAGHSWNLYPMP